MKNPLGKLIATGMRHLDHVTPKERAQLLEAGARVLEGMEDGQALAECAAHTAAVIRESESAQLELHRILDAET